MESNRPVAKVIEVFGDYIKFSANTSLENFGSMAYNYVTWNNYDSARMISTVRRYLDWNHLQPLRVLSRGDGARVIFSLYDERTTLYNALRNIYAADGHLLCIEDFLKYHADDLRTLDTWDIGPQEKYTIMLVLCLISDCNDVEKDRKCGALTISKDIALNESAMDLLKVSTWFYYSDEVIMSLCHTAFCAFTDTTGDIEVCDDKDENIYPDKISLGVYDATDYQSDSNFHTSCWKVRHPTE